MTKNIKYVIHVKMKRHKQCQYKIQQKLFKTYYLVSCSVYSCKRFTKNTKEGTDNTLVCVYIYN